MGFKFQVSSFRLSITNYQSPTPDAPKETNHLSPISNNQLSNSSFIIHHSSFIIILTLFTILTLYQSVILPLGEAADETDHYQYHRFVARSGHPPFTEEERREAGFKGGLAPLYYWLTAWPIALIGPDAPPDIRRVDARPQRHIPTDGLGINHVMHTLDEAWPWRGQTLAWHLIRFFSLPLGIITIIATYALVRRLLPEPKIAAVGAAAFVAFLPRFVISSAVINDDNLVFALTALLLLVQVIILKNDRPPTPKIMAVFGALFGLSLITKYFSLILIPEIILTLVLIFFKIKKTQSPTLRPSSGQISNPSAVSEAALRTSLQSLNPLTPSLLLTPYSILPFLIALFLTAGPWYIFIIRRFNRINDLGFIPGLAASLGEPQITEGLVGLLSGQSVRPVAATYALPEWFSLLYRSFWFEYGWMQIFAPTWIYLLFTIFAALAAIGLIKKIWDNCAASYRSKGLVPPSVAQAGSVRLLAQAGSVIRRLWPRQTQATDLQTIEAPNAKNLDAPDPQRNPIIGAIKNFFGFMASALRLVSPTSRLLTLHLLLFVIVLITRYILSATIDTGQGRHLYPALPVMALLASLGLYYFYRLASTFIVKKLPLPLFLASPNASHPPFLLPVVSYLLPATFFLLPAAISLLPSFTINNSSFTIHHSSFILPHCRTIPAAASPILLPIDQRQSIEFDSRLWLVGLETTGTITAGDALPATIYWFAENEPRQDYLISLCLQDDNARPVACWRGHFDDGHYPARAWERGDTLANTIFIPIPTCTRLTEQTYTLHLEIWPLDSTVPTPSLVDPPLLQHTFTEPEIVIQPTDSLPERSQTIDLWHANQQLSSSTEIGLNQSLTQITYTAHDDKPSPGFQNVDNPKIKWRPLDQFNTQLHLLCDEDAAPIAQVSHFIVDPTLTTGIYQTTSKTNLPPISLSLRDRLLAPITTTLSFSNTLSPLTLQLPNRPTLNLNPNATEKNQSLIPNLQSPISTLPVTIRWQTQRWMAEPLIIALKLLDKDFTVAGERVATLGDRYPNILWVPTEIIEETYPIQIKPDTPPGIYVLEMSLLRQDENLPDGFEYLPLTNNDTHLGNNLYPLTIRLLDPAHDNPPAHPLDAQLGQSIQLTGYDLNPASPITNNQLPITFALHWQSTAPLPTDYTVFTQLIGPDGQVWAQWDNPPQAGRYPTPAWADHDPVIDRYSLALKEGAPPGDYRLLVGMYDPATGERLPATIDGQPQPNNAIELTIISFEF